MGSALWLKEAISRTFLVIVEPDWFWCPALGQESRMNVYKFAICPGCSVWAQRITGGENEKGVGRLASKTSI